MDTFTCPECKAFVQKNENSKPGCPCCGYKAQKPASVQSEEDKQKAKDWDDFWKQLKKWEEEMPKINDLVLKPNHCPSCGKPYVTFVTWTSDKTTIGYPNEFIYVDYCRCHEYQYILPYITCSA